MKFSLIIIFFPFVLFSQSPNYEIIERHSVYYKDLIYENVTYGNYAPTDLIGLDDNSLIISSSISISFPDRYAIHSETTKEYFKKLEEIDSKSHISSGSIIKLNKEFKKEWELIFKDKRVEKIKLTSNGEIIAVGERLDMKKFWVGIITNDGKIVWEKEFKNKKNSIIADIEIDSLNNLFILLESSRILPVQPNKNPYQKRRLVFFKESDEFGIYLTKISPRGNRKWTKNILQKRSYNGFGRDIKLNQNQILISYSYESHKRVNDSLISDEATVVTVLDQYGKIIKSIKTDNYKLLFLKKVPICASAESNNSNELVIEKDFKAFKTLVVPDEIKYYWLEEGVETDKGYYLFGSNSRNLGYFILGLNRNYELVNYWQSENSNGEHPIGIIIQSDGSIIVVGQKTDKNIALPYGNARYIDIIKLKTGV